jgi:hypothetical protein
MTEVIKIKVDFEKENTKAFLDFITDTQEGKYSKEKLDLSSIKYARLDIQDNDVINTINEQNREEVLFFGISS